MRPVTTAERAFALSSALKALANICEKGDPHAVSVVPGLFASVDPQLRITAAEDAEFFAAQQARVASGNNCR